jgi:cyanophycin synthetase
MKIKEIRVMRGPNFWSIRRTKLIVMTLDLEELEELPTNKIDGFLERLKNILPTMESHRCSVGAPGGFFSRVEEGTWMGHVIEHIALEIQTLADMDTGFGRTRGTGNHGEYSVVFSYLEENVGKYAALASVRIAEALIAGSKYDLTDDIQHMRELREESRLGPSTGSIVEEAASRGIPWIRLNKHSLVQLGYGANQKRIQATVASTTSNIAVEIACDKEDTKDLLEANGIAVPRGKIVRTEEGMFEAIAKVGYPIVCKPINGNHGRGATINITNDEDAKVAFEVAREHSRSVIVEKYISGFDHRLLVINHEFIAGARRTPASVIGNGKSTLKELIDEVNSDPRRGYGHERVLTAIKVDHHTELILKEKGLTLGSIIPADELLLLKPTANLSTGGTAEDITDQVHPYNVFMAERISKIIGLDICGIDIIAEDLTIPLDGNNGAVIEVNAGPGFRMHLAPTHGIARNVAANVVDMLFPIGADFSIPIIAITGTNGKTTTSRLMAHLVKTMGYKVGFTTSDGIYIQNRMLEKGDCTGPGSAEFVLKDPTVNFAILETARGGILRAGLGFRQCDIAIVTNIAADHLGLKGINTLEDLAKVKAIVPESVKPDGYAILNADDDYVYEMRKNLQCKVAFFSMDENNPRIIQHCNKGGLAAIYENGYISIKKGDWKIRVDKAVNVPLTFRGKANFNIANCLPTVLASFIRGFKIEDIRIALQTFIPSPTQTPGRMNMFRFKNFDLMLDYAHNPAGFRAIADYLKNIEATEKVGIIAGVGDRRDEDILELGRIAAQMFDKVIIRQDKNLRGRSEENLIDLMKQGIFQQDPSKEVIIIPKEREAIEYAVSNAKKDSFIVICSDVIPAALDLVKELHEKEDPSMTVYVNSLV